MTSKAFRKREKVYREIRRAHKQRIQDDLDAEREEKEREVAEFLEKLEALAKEYGIQ